MEPKRCLILDVRKSSLEVDRRVPGNRDEFLFPLPSCLYRPIFPPLLLCLPQEFSCPRKPIVTRLKYFFDTNRLQDFFFYIQAPDYVFFFFTFTESIIIRLLFSGLGKILFWKSKVFKDIYNLYSQYLNVVDDCFVEFVHSLARKSTNSSDSPVKIREKLFSLFSASKLSGCLSPEKYCFLADCSFFCF